jgi:phospholipase/carboxylesterase
MALEATQLPELLACRVVSLSGRYAEPPRTVTTGTTYHFIHGEMDQVIAAGYAVDAADRLAGLGANVTVDIIPGLGHQVNEAVIAKLVARINNDAGA